MLQLTAAAEPPMAGDSKNYRQPYAEDCSDDDEQQSHGVSIDADASPGKANVRTKRSNPDNMGTDQTPTKGRVPTFDGKSDSGYSSQSVAGMSSADSAASATSSHPAAPVHAVPAAPSPTPAPRASRPPHQRQHSTQSSQSASRPPSSRRDSQPLRRPTTERRPTISQVPVPAPPKRRDSRNDSCTVPGCTKCGPDAIEPRPRQSRRQSMLHQPAESAPDVSHRYTQDTRSHISDPAPYHPSSPIDSRPPRQYHAQGGPVVQPAMTRRPSVSSRPARPTSYHADPRDSYRPHPNMQQERGPPPSMSASYQYAHQHLQHPMGPGYMPQSYGSTNPYFNQAQQMQPMPSPQPYEPQRPRLSARGTSMTSHVQPIVTQVATSRERPISARYPSHTSAPFYPPPQQIEYEEDEGSESESDFDSESEEEYLNEPRRRPVRKITDTPDHVVPQRRPSMRHAKTTPVLDRAHRNPQTVVVERPSRTEQERERTQRSNRRQSVSRPPLVPPIKSQSEYPSPRARIIVENPRSERRHSRQEYNMSTGGRERASQRDYNVEQKRQNRSSKVYDTGRDFEREYYNDDEDDDELDTRAPLSNRRRRDTDVDTRRRTHRTVEVKKKVDAAENYITAGRGDHDTYADQAYEVARTRSSRASGGPSEAESSRSKGSDKTNGEIRLRIGNDAPVTLSLNGDMEGRTVQLVPGENGMNELVISGNPRGEKSYFSERGSVRKALTSASQARRDAEEMTVRSSQSSRTRRGTRDGQDEPRRVLHSRRPRTERREEVEYRR